MIAVTGASGAIGGRVAERLAHHGEPMRLLVRDAAKAPALDGAEVGGRRLLRRPGGDAPRLRGSGRRAAGFRGREPDRVALHRGTVDAAAAAGVGHLVRVAGHPPQTLADFLRENPESYTHLTAG